MAPNVQALSDHHLQLLIVQSFFEFLVRARVDDVLYLAVLNLGVPLHVSISTRV